MVGYCILGVFILFLLRGYLFRALRCLLHGYEEVRSRRSINYFHALVNARKHLLQLEDLERPIDDTVLMGKSTRNGRGGMQWHFYDTRGSQRDCIAFTLIQMCKNTLLLRAISRLRGGTSNYCAICANSINVRLSEGKAWFLPCDYYHSMCLAIRIIPVFIAQRVMLLREIENWNTDITSHVVRYLMRVIVAPSLEFHIIPDDAPIHF